MDFINKAQESLKGNDLFGVDTSQQQEADGKEHNTLLGSIMSILIRVVFVFYIYIQYDKAIKDGVITKSHSETQMPSDFREIELNKNNVRFKLTF